MLATLRSDLGAFVPYLKPSIPILAVLQLLMILRPLLGGFGFMLIIPLLAIAGIVEQEPTGNLALLLDMLPDITTLTEVLAFFVVIMLVIASMNYAQATLGESVEQQFLHSLRTRLYRSMINAEWRYLGMTHQSDYTRIVAEEVEAISASVDEVLQMIGQVLLILVYTAFCLVLSPPLTLLAIGLGVILFAVTIPIQSMAISIGGKHLAASKALHQKSAELIKGIKAIKSSSSEVKQISEFQTVSAALAGEERNFARLSAMSTFGYSMSSVITFCVLTFVALEYMMAGIPTLVLLALIFSRIMPQVSTLYVRFQRVAYFLPSVSEVSDLVRLCELHQETDGEGASFDVTGGIQCDDISYLYPEARVPVISHLSVQLQPGELIAVTGTSGIGKSTFADILTGITLPTSGRLIVGSDPICEQNLKAWRQQVTYVPQEPFLVAGTVKDNLTLLSSEPVDDEQVHCVLRSASADFVFQLPDSIDTLIGDDGVNLSGGERQRLLVARALLSECPVMVFDESTSQLDYDTEDGVLKVLQGLKQNRIIVFISHRSSIQDLADQVIAINDQ